MMKDPTEFKQRFKRWQEGEKVYEAGKILPEVVVTADDPIKKLVEDVNARSNADFVNRVKDPNRTWIQDWEHDGYVATHKLSWAEDGGKAIVFPNVQNINGELHDFTDPKYNHGKWDALDSAIERGDTLLMTPKQAKMYTENYKKYYPKGKTFDCGKSLPKYDGGTDDKTYLPEYEYEATVTPQGTSLEKHKRITNEEDWLKYWGDVGAGYVNKALNEAAPYVLNGMSMLMGNPIGALGGIIGSTFGEELGANLGPTGRTVGGLVGGIALDPEKVLNLRKIKFPTINAVKSTATLTNSEWDDMYNAAIKSGDMNEVLRIRDAHFMSKSNTSVAKDGLPIKTYHTVGDSYPADFVEFNPDIEGTHSAIYTSDSPLMSGTYSSRLVSEAEKEAYIRAGIENMKLAVQNEWVHGSDLLKFKEALKSPQTAMEYVLNRTPQLRLPILTERQKSLYIKLNNPLKIAGRGRHWNNIPIDELPEDVYKELKSSQMSGYTTRDIEAAQMATGNYDGAIIDDITDYGGSWKSTMRQLEPGAVYLINSPSDLKLSDAITYDNSGNIIPISKRDDFNINDIRYGLVPLVIGGSAAASVLENHDKGKSIHIKPANRGKFNATKKRTGKTTEQLAHSKNPLTRKRAIFALNSRKFKH